MIRTFENSDHIVCCASCNVPLVSDLSVAGCEWWCYKCKRFTAFFSGGHRQTTWGALSDKQKLHFYFGELKQLERYEANGDISSNGLDMLRELRNWFNELSADKKDYLEDNKT